MKRIVIIGSCGSGKTTLGRHLAENLGYPITDLDELHWLPNWVERPREEFTLLIEKTVSTPTWIICGNYSKFRHLIWPKVDTIIWIDPPLFTLLRRVLTRSIKRMIDKKPMCNGNYETLGRLFCKKSIVIYLLKNYYRHRRSFSEAMQTVTHVKWIHIRGKQFLEPRQILESYSLD